MPSDRVKHIDLEKIYGHIQLTDDELKAAVLEAKIKKYFHQKNKEYWQQLEQNQCNNKKSNS
jgi:hypothetical protein